MVSVVTPGATIAPASASTVDATLPLWPHRLDDFGRLDAILVPGLVLAGVGIGRPGDVLGNGPHRGDLTR